MFRRQQPSVEQPPADDNRPDRPAPATRVECEQVIAIDENAVRVDAIQLHVLEGELAIDLPPGAVSVVRAGESYTIPVSATHDCQRSST